MFLFLFLFTVNVKKIKILTPVRSNCDMLFPFFKWSL
uniref:Uncharacterized protein n=1 Tax=Anguilla anguilla TaxID=7936 RepID=A0A0E9VIQ5_ANGAN